jgi:hypothetical protein
MKTRNFLIAESIKQSLQWERKLSRVWHWLQSCLRGFLYHVRMIAQSQNHKSVIQALLTGLTASRLMIRNKRQVVGFVMLVVGIASVFAHQFLLDMYAEPHDVCRVLGSDQCYNRATREGWCYMSWFYYYETIRFCVAAILLTVAGFLFTPPNKSVSVIFFSALQGAAWAGLFHYTFSVNSHETYHLFPHWHFIIVGLTLGFGVIVSADYVGYIWNHRILAFEKRLLTLYNGCDLVDGEKFKGLFKKYVEEKKAFQKQY